MRQAWYMQKRDETPLNVPATQFDRPPFARIDSKIDSLILLSLTDWKAGGSLRPLFSHLLEVL